MRIYIKGPDGKPLIPKEKTYEEKREIIKDHIRDILECVVELIPADWSKAALYAEITENGISFQIVYSADGYARQTSKAAEKNLYTGKIYEDRKTELVDAVKRLYEIYIEFGGKWEVLSLVFGSVGEYTAEFIEQADKELTPAQRIEKWKNEKLKVHKKEDKKETKRDISAKSIVIYRKDADQ